VLRRGLGLLTVFFFLVGFIAHFINPLVFISYYLLYCTWGFSMLIESAYFFFKGKKMVKQYSEIDWEQKCKELNGVSRSKFDNLVHLIVLPNYKETPEVIPLSVVELEVYYVLPFFMY
jgi:hypothetical protein